MIRLGFILAFLFGMYGISALKGQGNTYDLSYYIEAAKAHSPLLQDYHNQITIQQLEQQRLKAFYTRSKLELNGDYLFVPIISEDGGRTSFQWNAQNATDYYGYDLGESSGHLHAGVTWRQPLLGRGLYKVAEQQTRIQSDILFNNIRLEEHQLERTVTEQYLLCLLDKNQMNLADSIGKILRQQELAVKKLVRDGIARQSDLHLLAVEQAANSDLGTASRQSYYTHLSDLNILCGITDTAEVELETVSLYPRFNSRSSSSFLEQYRLDSLNVLTDLRAFKSQYKPQLNLFVDGGIQVSEYAHWYRHVGWSAGLTFTWTIFDGRQKQWKERQAQVQMHTLSVYKTYTRFQNEARRKQCLTEMLMYEERLKTVCKQLSEYNIVLTNYMKEIQAGQRSVIDYITVLRNKIQTERDCIMLQTNRQLLIAAYNYWNW